MKSMKPVLFVLAVLSLFNRVMADDPNPQEEKSKAIEHSLESFAGTWEIVTVQPAGSTKDAKRLVFRKDQTYSALDAENQPLWSGTFDLDPTQTPKVWDHRSNESKKNGGDALGIYELEGDKLKLCCVVGVWQGKQWTGKPRPKAFELPEADVILELRRMKSDK